MAGTYDITCEQGATFRRQLTWRNPDGTPINVTGYSAKMQVRASKDAADALLTLSSVDGGLTLGGSQGTIVMTASAATTGALSAGAYVYDLEMTAADGTVTRLLAGSFTVDGQVTR